MPADGKLPPDEEAITLCDVVSASTAALEKDLPCGTNRIGGFYVQRKTPLIKQQFLSGARHGAHVGTIGHGDPPLPLSVFFRMEYEDRIRLCSHRHCGNSSRPCKSRHRQRTGGSDGSDPVSNRRVFSRFHLYRRFDGLRIWGLSV